MKEKYLKILYALLSLLFVMCFVCPSAYSAKQSISIDRDQSFYELHSVLMEINEAEHYVIVGEQRIDLIDIKRGAQRYKTMIRNSQEKEIPFHSLHDGNMVFIRGLELPDGHIMAREIYRLPKSVQTGRALQKYHFYKEIPIWEAVK